MIKSPFHELHTRAGAVMVERGGYLVPEHYGDAEAEYRCGQESIAVFDWSFCPRVRVGGKDARKYLCELTNQSAKKIYSEQQGEVAFEGFQGGALVQNQGNNFLVIGKGLNGGDLGAFLKAGVGGANVDVRDETAGTAMIYLHGPGAVKLLKKKLPFDISCLEGGDVSCMSYFFMSVTVAVHANEVGASLIIPAKMAGTAWDMLEKYGREYGMKPAGVLAAEKLGVFNGRH